MARRTDYNYFLTIPTRWMDNDAHGHVNNVEYYSFFDTVVTTWLIEVASFDVRSESVVGLCVESQCSFKMPITFPERVEAALRVGRIGNSSVRYEISLFRAAELLPAASGYFVHVYVDRETRRPVTVPGPLRSALQSLYAASPREPSPKGQPSDEVLRDREGRSRCR
jgi:acyl-CoA thioester hydrolase